MPREGVERALKQPLADETVETRQHNAETRAVRNQIPFNGLHVLHNDNFRM
jgi:hypothetical protein